MRIRKQGGIHGGGAKTESDGEARRGITWAEAKPVGIGVRRRSSSVASRPQARFACGIQTAQGQSGISELGRSPMKYMFAWLLGVPGVVIELWRRVIEFFTAQINNDHTRKPHSRCP
jgi:hypothetical protein